MPRLRAVAGIGWLVALALLTAPLRAGAVRLAPQAQAGARLDPGYLDELLAPVALYPDQLLAQMLLSAGNPAKVAQLDGWLKRAPALKGSDLQQAAERAGFEPSFVALVLFPQVVELMAISPDWTAALGSAFAGDRAGVFDAIQRLRKKSHAAGNLKSTPQQTVGTETTQAGEQVIVIEPANPQVVYVPQYDPQVVYVQPTTTTTVVVHDNDNDEAVAAVVGFTAGVVIGAALNNNYYYGPYGWRGGAYMYNDAWDDWYDNRSDAREDYYENREDARENYSDRREDVAGERSDRAEDAREQRSERSENAREQRGERAENTQQQRTDRQETRSSAATERAASGERRTSAERSGTRSDAFSGYSSGSSTRSASSRGERSRSGGGRSRKR